MNVRQKMKIAAVIMMCVAVAGCLSFTPDPRVIGSFKATAGEVVDIRSDGRIFFASEKREEFVGLATISTQVPLSIHVVGPDTSPLVGTKIVFSPDGRSIEVEWPKWRRTGDRARPSKFQKE